MSGIEVPLLKYILTLILDHVLKALSITYSFSQNSEFGNAFLLQFKFLSINHELL